jgi:hypothetical protein
VKRAGCDRLPITGEDEMPHLRCARRGTDTRGSDHLPALELGGP